ncbi:hypothetical protein [Sorangium sp. So ce1151]|uniref:hypothetical protein n=1 Tax=Sorangium sp. So ce1151 TaxID=3133332 RepID=UPI003F5F7875
MSIVDIYVSGDGNNAANGSSWSNRVQTFTRARQIAAGVGAGNVPRFVVGQFDMSLGASSPVAYSQRLGTGIDANNVPHGWLMTAHDPSLPWHFRDHRVIGNANDFAQVYTNDGGATFNVQKSGRTIVGMTDNGGTPAGVGTGVWAVTLASSSVPVVASTGDYAARVDRVWRGGSPATLSSPTAYLSSQDPFNELWEAQDFTTLGKDGTHAWTQMSVGEAWPTGTFGPGSNVLFVYSPKGNPATVWGGVTVLVRRGTFLSGPGYIMLLSIENSNGWAVDSTVRFLGGVYSAVQVSGNCDGWALEPTVEAGSFSYPNVSFKALSSGTQRTFSNFKIAPRIDMKVWGKPYYPIDASHSEGSADAIQLLAAGGIFTGGVVRGRTAAGEPCYVRDPAHSAIGRGVPSGGADINGFVIESDLSVHCGSMQYQRAYVFNGDKTNLRNITIGGKIYNQRTPTQLDGDVNVVGIEFHNANPMIPAHPDADQTGLYKGRFSVGQTRNFASTHPNGKNRDGIMLAMNVTGRQAVIGCVFNGTHAAGLSAGKVVGGTNATPGADEALVVARNTFVNRADSRAEQCAVLVDARASFGQAMRCINNAAVGYPPGGGAQHVERDGYYRWSGPLESLGQPFVDGGANNVKGSDGAGLAENVGWKR